MARAKHAWWVTEALRDRISSVLAVTAGLGSGKTHGFCQWHYCRGLDNVGSRFSAFMEPTYQKIHDTAIPTYEKILDVAGLKSRHYEIVKSPYPKLIFKDRKPFHEVHFLSAEAPDKIAGVEYAFAVEDEAGINKGEARRNLRTRMFRDPLVIIPQFLLGGAPQGINEFAEEFDSDTLEGWDRSVDRDHFYRKLIEGALVQKRRFTVWTDDNPFIRPEYIAEIMETYGHNPNLIKSYRYGVFCPFSEGGCFTNYFPQKHDIEDIEPDPSVDIDLSFDFNAAPLAFVVGQILPYEEFGDRVLRLTIIHEASGGSNNLDDAVVEFAQKLPPSKFADTQINIYGDSTGHHSSHKIRGTDYDNIRTMLRQLGYRRVTICAAHSNPQESASVDEVQKILLNGYFRLCRRCKNTRNSLQATKWKKGVRKIDKPSSDTWTHHADALKYLIYTAYQNFRGMAIKKIYGTNG